MIVTGSRLYRPSTVADAVEALADGDAELLAGGTDLVPALRTGRRRPRRIVALRRILDLRARGASADTLIVGAGVTYHDLVGWSLSPGLAATARVVGSPQTRNAGTVGGALGTANPRGDLLTFLAAVDADVVLQSVRGVRTVTLQSFLVDGASPTEMVTAVRLPRPCGPQVYLKIGSRQAASAALVSCALVVDRVRERVNCAVSGVTGRPLRLSAAEEFARGQVDWSTATLAADAVVRFGELVTEAAGAVPDPLPDDPRASVTYRGYAAGVLAARAAGRCLAGPVPGPRPSAVSAASAGSTPASTSPVTAPVTSRAGGHEG